MKHVSTCTHAQLGEDEKKILKSVISIYWNPGEAKPRRLRLLCRSGRGWTWSVKALIYTQELFNSSLLLEYTALCTSWKLDLTTLSSQCLISFLFTTCIHGVDVQIQHMGRLRSGFHIFFSVPSVLCEHWHPYLSLPVCVIYAVNRVCCSTRLFCQQPYHAWMVAWVSQYIGVDFTCGIFPVLVSKTSLIAIVGCALKSMFEHYKWVLYMVPPGGLITFLHVPLEPLKC